jgi:hypothetical protein
MPRPLTAILAAGFAGFAGFAAVLSGAAPALGCPLCTTDTGERVRAGLFGGGAASFLADAAATLLPFPVLAAAILLIRSGFAFGETRLCVRTTSRPLPPTASPTAGR